MKNMKSLVFLFAMVSVIYTPEISFGGKKSPELVLGAGNSATKRSIATGNTVKHTFDSPLTQTMVLGQNLYTVTIGEYNPPTDSNKRTRPFLSQAKRRSMRPSWHGAILLR
jgi:hypothetical protein